MSGKNCFNVLRIGLVDGAIGETDVFFCGGAVLECIAFGESFYMLPCFFRVKFHFTNVFCFVFQSVEFDLPYLFFEFRAGVFKGPVCFSGGVALPYFLAVVSILNQGRSILCASSNYVGFWFGVSVRVFSATVMIYFLRGRCRFLLCRGPYYYGLLFGIARDGRDPGGAANLCVVKVFISVVFFKTQLDSAMIPMCVDVTVRR